MTKTKPKKMKQAKAARPRATLDARWRRKHKMIAIDRVDAAIHNLEQVRTLLRTHKQMDYERIYQRVDAVVNETHALAIMFNPNFLGSEIIISKGRDDD